MQVGFIGLGQMGSGMARNLLKAGHTVTVYNRTPAKADALVAEGAARAATIADACRGEAVVTMLANDQAAEEVVFGPEGLLATLPKGALHVSASTIGVELSERLAAAHAATGQLYVSAPVFGRPDVAAAGNLFVVAAGADAAVAAARPLLDAVGQRTFVLSDLPARANLVKLSGNFLIACVIESLGEALALVGKAGIDKGQYLELLTSTLFGAPVYKNYGRLLAEPGDHPVGFAAPLGLKDIKLALAAAEALEVPLPLASLLRDRFITLLATGGADKDWSAIGLLAGRDAGTP
ncbi:NAD(P)-dependent oxidoreductase [Xanthobacter sediminis]